MKALSNKDGIIAAAAMDQRGSLQKSIATAKGVDQKAVTPEMMSEFKTRRHTILTPHASAILLDPEFGLEAAKARASNAGLLLAYEETGYDNTKPGRLPDLLPHVSAKRIVDWGADAVKILIYYTPFDDPQVNDIKHAFIERIGAECEVQPDPVLPGVRRLRSQGRQRERSGVRQDQAASGDRQHEGVHQTAIQRGRPESGSPGERGVRRRQLGLQRPEGVHATPKRSTYYRQGGGSRDQAVHLSERRRQQRAVRREPETWPPKPAPIIRESCAAARPGKTACRSTPPRA